MSNHELVLDTEYIQASIDEDLTVDDSSIEYQILEQLQVTNGLISLCFGALLFIFGLMLITSLYRLIKHNVTDFF